MVGGNLHQMNDGQVGAHRAAWRAIVASGVPTTIFEDDIRLLAAADDAAADARAMVARCAASGSMLKTKAHLVDRPGLQAADWPRMAGAWGRPGHFPPLRVPPGGGSGRTD